MLKDFLVPSTYCHYGLPIQLTCKHQQFCAHFCHSISCDPCLSVDHFLQISFFFSKQAYKYYFMSNIFFKKSNIFTTWCLIMYENRQNVFHKTLLFEYFTDNHRMPKYGRGVGYFWRDVYNPSLMATYKSSIMSVLLMYEDVCNFFVFMTCVFL